MWMNHALSRQQFTPSSHAEAILGLSLSLFLVTDASLGHLSGLDVVCRLKEIEPGA